MKLICHACKYPIATVGEGIIIPLIGAMFGPADPIHNKMQPFSPVITWENMHCPMCARRPFPIPDADGHIIIETDEGQHVITSDGLLKVGDVPTEPPVDILSRVAAPEAPTEPRPDVATPASAPQGGTADASTEPVAPVSAAPAAEPKKNAKKSK